MKDKIKVLEAYEKAKNDIIKQSLQPYDTKNQDHEDKILKLWNILKPGVKLPSRLTNDW